MEDDHMIAVVSADPREDGTPQYVWTCACGERGIPVGSPYFAGGEWAAGAGKWHVIQALQGSGAL